MTVRSYPRALRSLFVVVSFVAMGCFALTAYGMYSFARTVWLLPAILAACVPIAADLLSVCGILTMYILRDARGGVRAYAWSVFLFFTACSVAGNEAFAAHEQLAGTARVAAALPPVALAFAAHLLVIVARMIGRPAAIPTAPSAIPSREIAPRATRKADTVRPVDTPAAIAAPRRKAGKVRAPGRAPHPRRDDAVRAVMSGRPASAVAREIDVTPRAVQNWVAEHRATDVASRVNGSRPEVEVP